MPHRQSETAALFLSRNVCSILGALSFPPSFHLPQTQPHISAHSALLLPHRITYVNIVVIQTANVKPAITQSVGFYVPPLSLLLPYAAASTHWHTLGYTPRLICQAFLFISVVITQYFTSRHCCLRIQTCLFKMRSCTVQLAHFAAAASLRVFAEDKPRWHKILVPLQQNLL